MESQAYKIRIYLEDNEIEIKYSLMTTNDIISDTIDFILNEVRKKHQTMKIQLKNIDNNQDLLNMELISSKKKEAYLDILCKPNLKTRKDSQARAVRDCFDLTDNSSIIIQKFKDIDIAKEKVTYNISVLRKLNDMFKNQQHFFINDQNQKQDNAIPTPSIFINNEQVQNESQYVPKKYEDAQDDNPNDILKQKKDFKKTGGAGGSYEFVKEAQKQKQVELQGYTPKEIAEHNTRDDCWTVYQGKVYDITRYIRYHPGGDKILLGAGKDCTALFTKYHSWVNASFLLQKYQVGFLVMK